jgi:hypothetical protein
MPKRTGRRPGLLVCVHCGEKPADTESGLQLHKTRYCKAYREEQERLFEPLPPSVAVPVVIPLQHAPQMDLPGSQGPTIPLDQAPLVDERALPPTRSGRARRRPNFNPNMVPTLRAPIPHMPPPPIRTSTHVPLVPSPTPPPLPLLDLDGASFGADNEGTPSTSSSVDDIVTTELDAFGVWRVYPHMPSHNPDQNNESVKRAWVSREPIQGEDKHRTWLNWLARLEAVDSELPIYYPLRNMTEFLIVEHHLKSSTKSQESTQDLIDNVFGNDGFEIDDARTIRIHQSLQRLDVPEFAQGGHWQVSTVKLKVPCPKYKKPEARTAKIYEVGGVWHKSLTAVMADFFRTLPWMIYI